ncbi:MAG: hypothetical protein EOO40_01040 [Deltaproteobacteria bacterium]|nr:MAG: hypothetical protein EOO40_01040 [Deltaproteobacteria bacterium]
MLFFTLLLLLGVAEAAVVAHPDDELVFMTPNWAQMLRRGQALRVLYLTAGDAGEDAAYWLRREQGMQAAYAEAIGTANLWQRGVRCWAGRCLAAAALVGHEVTLAFLRLPDGMLDGRGSARYGPGLAALVDDSRATSRALADGSCWTQADLRRLVLAFVAGAPAVHTLEAGGQGEHPDHLAAGALSLAAACRRRQPPQLFAYTASRSSRLPANLPAATVAQNVQRFARYVRFDPLACAAAHPACVRASLYGPMLARQIWREVRCGPPAAD